MSISENVKVLESNGSSECLVCERKILAEETCLNVSFNIDLIVTRKRVSKDMHTSCAEDLRDLLARRIQEAKKKC